MENEIWKDVPEYEGFYKVSNYGNAKRLESIIKSSSVNGGKRKVKEKVLKNSITSWGYVNFDLSVKGVITHKAAHRLVAQLFILNPKNKPCVNHKNGIKTDNRVENLEWVTYSENFAHANSTGLRKHRYKKVLDISTGIIYNSLTEASNFCTVKVGNLSCMLHGKTKNKTNATTNVQ